MVFTSRTQKARFALLIASSAILLNPGAARPAEKTVAPQISIVSGSTTQIEDAQWALSRFRAAGIELPSLQIMFHDDYQACGNREGVLRIAGERAEIHECESDRSRSRRSLLHELAHAWDHMAGGITQERRARFLETRNLSSWDPDGLPWQERGEEQAAEIIAWGLMLDAAPIPTRVGNHGPQDESLLAAAFETLTGDAPLFSPVPGTSQVTVAGATGQGGATITGTRQGSQLAPHNI
jgi:hypothetical protein